MIKPEIKVSPADTQTAVTEEYTKAFNLNAKIILSAQMAQQNLYEVCKGLKEMRDDKLYKELGYQNFEDYCENEVGIKYRQAFNYIKIIETYGENLQPVAGFGTTKLALLTTLSEEERTEITENNDVESISKRELEEKVREIKSLREKTDEQSSRIQSLESENTEKNKELDNLARENASLVKQVEELENRPVEVAVESNSREIENMRKAMSKLGTEMEEKNRVMQEEAIKEQRRLHMEYNEKINQLTADYEKRLAEASESNTEAVPDVKETFKAYYSLAYNSFSSLVSFIKKQSDEDKQFCYEKAEKLINILNESMKGE